MIKILIGYLLIILDCVISPDKKAKFDLFPDFVGYILIIYSFYKIWKDNKQSKQITDQIKLNGAVTAVAFVVSYISYLLDMYGILAKQSNSFNAIMGAVNDAIFLVVIFLFIQLLKSIQADEQRFQIKRMNMLWRFMALCIVCEYISLTIVEAAYAFMLFGKVIALIFAAYIFTSGQTYKMIQMETINNSSEKDNGKKTSNSGVKTTRKKTMNIQAIANSQKFKKDK